MRISYTFISTIAIASVTKTSGSIPPQFIGVALPCISCVDTHKITLIKLRMRWMGHAPRPVNRKVKSSELRSMSRKALLLLPLAHEKEWKHIDQKPNKILEKIYCQRNRKSDPSKSMFTWSLKSLLVLQTWTSRKSDENVVDIKRVLHDILQRWSWEILYKEISWQKKRDLETLRKILFYLSKECILFSGLIFSVLSAQQVFNIDI